MRQININLIANIAIIAALYVALTWVLAPISYGSIQFRISEALILLVLVNPKYSIGILIGTFIANTTSSLGWYDMVFGTLATGLAIIPMLFIKNINIGAIFPVISNAIIVAIELLIVFEINFWFSFVAVAIGEAVVLYLIGIPLMHFLAKNEMLVEVMNLDVSHIKDDNKITIRQIIVFILSIVGLIFFFSYPVGNDVIDGENTYITIFSLSKENPYLYIILASVIIYAFTAMLKNNIRYISIIPCLAILIIFSFIPTFDINLEIGYIIGFYIYILLLAFVFLFKKKKED